MLLLLELHLCGGADLDHADSTSELGDPLLQLLAIPVGVGASDLGLQLCHPSLDLCCVAGAVNNRGVVLGHHNATSSAQDVQSNLIKLETDLGRDNLATCQDADVLQHCLTAITEGGSLDGDGSEGAADLVHHQGGERLAVDVLSHNEQRPRCANDLLQ